MLELLAAVPASGFDQGAPAGPPNPAQPQQGFEDTVIRLTSSFISISRQEYTGLASTCLIVAWPSDNDTLASVHCSICKQESCQPRRWQAASLCRRSVNSRRITKSGPPQLVVLFRALVGSRLSRPGKHTGHARGRPHLVHIGVVKEEFFNYP